MSNTNLIYSGADQVEGIVARRNYLKGLNGIKNVNAWTPMTVSSYSQITGPVGALTTVGATGLTVSNTVTGIGLTSDGHMQLAKAGGASFLGQGIASPIFVVDHQDTAKVMNVSFTYEHISGTADLSGTSTQSLEVWLYDANTGTYIQPVGYRGMTTGTGAGRFTASFQTPANQDQLRLVIFCNDNTPNVFLFSFADFTIGTNVSSIANSPVAMRVHQNAAVTVTANTVFTFDTVEFDTNHAYSPSTGLFTVPIGGYYQINARIYSSANQYINIFVNGVALSQGDHSDASTGAQLSDMTHLNAGDTVGIVALIGGTTAASAGYTTNFSIFRISDGVSSSSGRVVVASVGLTNAYTVPSGGSPIIYDTKIVDTTNSFSTTTGLFTVPESGNYRVSTVALTTTGGGPAISVLQNGVVGAFLSSPTPSAFGSGTMILKCNAGDTLGITTNGSFTLTGGTAPTFTNVFSVELIGSNTANITAGTTVATKVALTTSITLGAAQTIPYDTILQDTTNSWSSSSGAFSGGTYTVPVSGTYLIAIIVNFSAGGTSFFYINGSPGNYVVAQSTGSATASGSCIQHLNAGDVIQIACDTAGTASGSGAPRYVNVFSMLRVGI